VKTEFNHFAFTSVLPDCFAEDLTKRRLCFPKAGTTKDNRDAWRVAYAANQLPYRVEGRSFQPFILEEIK
jgi:hypothetical protein